MTLDPMPVYQPGDQRHALLDDLARINPEVAARVARKLGVLA